MAIANYDDEFAADKGLINTISLLIDKGAKTYGDFSSEVNGVINNSPELQDLIAKIG